MAIVKEYEGKDVVVIAPIDLPVAVCETILYNRLDMENGSLVVVSVTAQLLYEKEPHRVTLGDVLSQRLWMVDEPYDGEEMTGADEYEVD